MLYETNTSDLLVNRSVQEKANSLLHGHVRVTLTEVLMNLDGTSQLK